MTAILTETGRASLDHFERQIYLIEIHTEIDTEREAYQKTSSNQELYRDSDEGIQTKCSWDGCTNDIFPSQFDDGVCFNHQLIID
jgi:hypothetical protein